MVKSVVRAIKILEFLGENKGVSVTDISKALTFPKSTTHEILATLEKERFITKNPYNRLSFRPAAL